MHPASPVPHGALPLVIRLVLSYLLSCFPRRMFHSAARSTLFSRYRPPLMPPLFQRALNTVGFNSPSVFCFNTLFGTVMALPPTNLNAVVANLTRNYSSITTYSSVLHFELCRLPLV